MATAKNIYNRISAPEDKLSALLRPNRLQKVHNRSGGTSEHVHYFHRKFTFPIQ
jgi:hypothetical protein